MKKPGSTSYTFTHRFKGETRLELFDRYYLRIREKNLQRQREYKLELAILNQEPIHVRKNAIHWLAAAALSALVMLYFIYLLIGSQDDAPVVFYLGVIFFTLLLATLFITLYVLTAERKWILETRAAHYPLVAIPYHKKNFDQALGFLQLLQSGIGKNIADKGYNNEVLFAGEMRMLRRLAKNHILSIDAYDRAKKHMLEKGGHMGMAS